MLCFSITITLFAQAERNCSTMENLAYRQTVNPQLKSQMQKVENFTKSRIQQMSNEKMSGGVITIPVVVHVIYSSAKENISLAQIKSQIEVLNEDYRRLNTDKDNKWSQAIDTKIEFCMAKVDPYGNPTNGVTRKSSTRADWGTNDDMKKTSKGGVNPWNSKEYLNMWVCNIGSGYLGYAQFPGGSSLTDGVVMSPQYFGSSAKGANFYLQAPFDLGRTATHEVGHYLNLRHIWGDGACSVDDFVSDTPLSDSANYGCLTSHTSCGTKDMVQNYMDYSDDSCMNLFTQGQKDRMWAVLSSGGYRSGLAASNKCDELVPPTCTDGVQNGDETGVDCGGPTCEPCKISCIENKIKLEITFDKFPEEVSWKIRKENGEVVTIQTYSSGNSDGSTVIEEICLLDGCYTFTMADAYGDGICCKEGNGSYKVTYGDKVLASGGDYEKEDVTSFCLGVDGSTCGDGVQNGDETGVDCGGSCKPCDANESIINEGNFEEGWDDWNDGGSDCYRYFGNRSSEGDYSIRLRDNSGGFSAMTSKTYDIKAYKSIEIEFYFYSYSMEVGEQFMFRFYNGKQWQTIESWYKGADFENNTFYKATLAIDALDYAFTNNAKFMLECKASSNSDHIYIDKVIIKGGSNPLKGVKSTLKVMGILEEDKNNLPEIDFTVYPNPIEGGALNIKMIEKIEGAYRIIDMYGQVVKQGVILEEIDVNYLNSGFYFVEFRETGEEGATIKKFIKK